MDRNTLIELVRLKKRRHEEEVRNLENKPEFLKEFWAARNDLKQANRRWNYLTSIDEVYIDRYFEKRNRRVRKWERNLGWALSQTFEIKSLIDFGCGLGSYLEGAKMAGTEKILGLELMYDFAIKYVPELIKPFVQKADVGESLDYGKWDCAMSVEVAEHIPEENSDVFVENLIRASERLIILTASRRSGTTHINPHFREWWIGKFVVRECAYSHELTQKLRDAWKVPAGNREYLLFNLMVFLAPNTFEIILDQK